MKWNLTASAVSWEPAMWGTSWPVFYLDSQCCLCCVYSTRKNVEKILCPLLADSDWPQCLEWLRFSLQKQHWSDLFLYTFVICLSENWLTDILPPSRNIVLPILDTVQSLSTTRTNPLTSIKHDMGVVSTAHLYAFHIEDSLLHNTYRHIMSEQLWAGFNPLNVIDWIWPNADKSQLNRQRLISQKNSIEMGCSDRLKSEPILCHSPVTFPYGERKTVLHNSVPELILFSLLAQEYSLSEYSNLIVFTNNLS